MEFCSSWFEGHGDWLCVALLCVFVPGLAWLCGYVMGMLEERRNQSRPSPLDPSPVPEHREAERPKTKRRRRRGT